LDLKLPVGFPFPFSFSFSLSFSFSFSFPFSLLLHFISIFIFIFLPKLDLRTSLRRKLGQSFSPAALRQARKSNKDNQRLLFATGLCATMMQHNAAHTHTLCRSLASLKLQLGTVSPGASWPAVAPPHNKGALVQSVACTLPKRRPSSSAQQVAAKC